MQIYQGIQLVYAHVVQLIQSVATWWQEVAFSEWVNTLPLQFQPIMTVLVVVLLSMATIGIVKKLSFLLG